MANPFAAWKAPGGLVGGNPFAAGSPGLGSLKYIAPTTAQGYNPDAFSPKVGAWKYKPPPNPYRDQLASTMNDRYGRGSDRGGYTTSEPGSRSNRTGSSANSGYGNGGLY